MNVDLGIIEGYYGRPWGWEDRRETIAFLASRGYRFYIYAPKADAFLRRRWTDAHPDDQLEALRSLAERCRAADLRFGIGLSPYDVHRNFDDPARAALQRKLDDFDAIGVQDLGLLFDDMRGDVEDLAERQARVVDWVAERFTGDRIIVCPSYYSDDPVLDRAFGERPPRYLETLGTLIDPAIHFFWTGEEVCSRELSPGHLEGVADRMRRRPFLWDNYPVNDGQRMSQYLHLRAFTGRPAANADHVSAHAVNPALQPVLTRIPALTLIDCYALGNRYAYGAAFRKAAEAVLGPALARSVYEDVLILQDVGLDRLGEREALLRERYEGVDHPAAREIVAWLDGEYRITDEIVRTQ